MTITLEAIKAEHTKVAQMIAAFEEQAKTRVLEFAAQVVTLKPGEEYAGVLLGKDGAPDVRLILLPGEAESVTWQEAKEWAASLGGELPTRREQSLLFANLKDHFSAAWYWSGEQHASDAGFAWLQHFDDGDQNLSRKSSSFRARAVRRLAIL